MKKNLEIDKIEKQEQDLTIIENSLFKSWNADKKEVITERNNLVFKIVDNIKVAPAKAREYLSILASRNIIRMDKDIVYYIPSEKKLNEIKRQIDMLDGMI